MKRLITTPTGWVEAILEPHQVSVVLHVFDPDGELLREEQYTWYKADQLAGCLAEVGVPANEVERIAAELAKAQQEEEARLPPGWVPRGCLIAFVLVTLMLTGLGFFIWLVATRVL